MGAFAAGCGGNESGGTSTAQLSFSQRTQLDAAIHRGLTESRAPGAVVGVQTPEGRYVRAVGVAGKASKTPMTTDMYQRIGSLTKTFTAALLMQLAGEGKVSLDDPIDKYVKGVPNGNEITLRQLADMTSGVASYTANPKFTDELFSIRSASGRRRSCSGSASRSPRSSSPEANSTTPTATTHCSGW